jgi:hypothetical protein
VRGGRGWLGRAELGHLVGPKRGKGGALSWAAATPAHDAKGKGRERGKVGQAEGVCQVGRAAQNGPRREGEREEGGWLGGPRRGPKEARVAPRAKRPAGNGGRVLGVFSYFLFSSKLLINEYFTETKQIHIEE